MDLITIENIEWHNKNVQPHYQQHILVEIINIFQLSIIQLQYNFDYLS